MRAPFSYDDSLKLLSTLQTNRAIRTSLDATTDKNKDAIPEMLEWFRKAGYEPADLARSGIKCVHVAGSSGKGSVCAMIENLLVHHQDYEDVDAVASERIQGQLEKIGTYTSPHLVDAGIIRAEPPAFTAPQVQGALEVVLRRAAVMDTITLGLLGDFQKDNASLAVVAAAAFLRDIGVDAESLPTPDEIADGDPLPDRFVRGLETVSWPGRCEIYKNGNLEWCLDGAHTDEGMRAVAKWFRGKMDAAYAETDTATMLIFNQDERDGNALLCTLIEALTDLEEGAVHYSRMFKFAAFCPNEAFPVAKGEEERDLSKQQKLLRTYMNMDRNAVAAVYSSVGEAVHAAVRVSDRTKQRALVLVTGSLHLVGAWIENVPEKHRLRSGK
ncbi:putative Folylpolyglutamate synthase [Glarea lozoyensis 74030]|uniref:tetrahydrofolate synthase n=1 Tax=Glarea lozoyensis (strain ATCC 74030 / MF5533) TaxID=1104152 RepID=H0EI45_GLAL7|nr:putative Folylpolyglutamate synthase [Glarea lozoyensis 74030]